MCSKILVKADIWKYRPYPYEKMFHCFMLHWQLIVKNGYLCNTCASFLWTWLASEAAKTFFVFIWLIFFASFKLSLQRSRSLCHSRLLPSSSFFSVFSLCFSSFLPNPFIFIFVCLFVCLHFFVSDPFHPFCPLGSSGCSYNSSVLIWDCFFLICCCCLLALALSLLE